MRKFSLLCLGLLLSAILYAQKKGDIKGIVYDTLIKKGVPDATITVLQQKDSSLVSFGMTDAQGRFNITDLPVGDYRLLITHVGYHNTTTPFSLTTDNRTADLGTITMNDKSVVLENVVVTAEAPPVTLIGDTVQYNAGSFKTQPHANVEQLLKKLPGVEVAKDGSIKAQGQNVGRVLVDGKEFFGNDPRMATKNLPADAIDKVQVYDKMSDQSQLTGFDDGNSEKTINLKLKKDKKKGSFGKVMAGGGTADRFEGRFNVNSFKGARQLSVVGMANNTNTEGFSFMDMMNFTGALNRMMQGGGSVSLSVSQSDPMASLLGNNNQGIRTIWGGGINYNNIIGTRTDFTSNYFYNNFSPVTQKQLQRQYLLPDSTFFYNQDALTDIRNNSHRLNLSFDHVIDSFHSVKVTPSIGYQRSRNYTGSRFDQRGRDGHLSNEGYNNNMTHSTAFNFNNDILLRKRFRKKGRTLSLSLQTTLNNSDSDGQLESVNDFYNALGANYRKDSINQTIYTKGDLKGYTGRLVYTEPLFKQSLIELSVANSYTSNRSDKTTYDYNSGNGKYDRLNDSLTNDFSSTYGYTNAGLRIRTQKKKFNYYIGLNWQQAMLEGKIIAGTKDSIISKRFVNMLPSARFQYHFTRYKNVALTYRSSTNQPTAAQLQPVPDISNPLNIREGNPDLQQEFTHNIQLNYSGVNPFASKNFFAFFNFSKTDNKILNADSLLATGVRKTKPVNVDGVYNMTGNINCGFPARSIKGNFRLGSSVFFNRGRQFVNGNPNTIHTIGAGPKLSLDANPGEKIDFSLSAGMNYNRSKYSLQPGLNNRFLSQEYEMEFNWQLPRQFYFSTDFVYTVNNQLAQGFNARIPLWGASLSRQFLRFNRGELKLRVNDILNKNMGVSRNANQNYIEDTRVNTLKRFFLLSFTYSLSKTGLNNAGGNGGMRIITR